jgi:hypothetical protein
MTWEIKASNRVAFGKSKKMIDKKNGTSQAETILDSLRGLAILAVIVLHWLLFVPLRNESREGPYQFEGIEKLFEDFYRNIKRFNNEA